MSKEWFAAKELQGANGLPSTVQNINVKANRESWLKRKRIGQGGGFEYHIESLPLETQQYLAKCNAENVTDKSAHYLAGKAAAKNLQQNKQLNADDKQRIMQNGAAQLMQLTGKARLRAEVKLAIIASYNTFLVPYINNQQKLKGEHNYAELYNEHDLEFDNKNVYRVITSICWNTCRKWIATLESQGAAALGGNYATKRLSKIDGQPAMLEMVQGLLFHEPAIGAANLFSALDAHSTLHDLEWNMPDVSNIRKWLKKYKAENPLLIEQLNNPDDFKNRRQVAWGQMDEGITRINQLWELDSTPSDVHLIDGRYSIIGAIDVYSRRPIVILQPTSNSEAVCLLMRKAMIEFGVPEAVKTDNGKDYLSKRVKTVLNALGIQQIVVPPFSGDKKPYIERFFRTWSHGISKLLPGYGGHDVATREKLQSRASFADRIMKKGNVDISIEMTSKDLQEVINDWIDHVYNHKEHRTIKQKPLIRWQSQRTIIRTIDNERALDILLSPVPASGKKGAGIRVVTKDVGIEVQGFSFVAAELGPMMGQNVFCSWNPSNIGEIYVFNSSKLEFICKAICPELANTEMSLGDISREAKRQQAAAIAVKKKELRKASRTVSPGQAARNVIAAAKKRNGSIIGMPMPTESADSGLLQQADIAASHQQEDTQLSAENFQRLRQEQIEMESAQKAAKDARPRFANDYEQYCWLLQQRKQRQLTAEEIVIRENYKQKSPKWAKQAEKMVGTDEQKTQEKK